MNDIYRGNKVITVGELKAFLDHFIDETEVVFQVDVDPSSSFYHVEELQRGLLGAAWIQLAPRET